MTVSRSRAGWIAKLLLLSGSLAITLVVLELGIRLFWGGYYLKAARAYAQPDALLGWGNRPNIRMQYGEPRRQPRSSRRSIDLSRPDNHGILSNAPIRLLSNRQCKLAERYSVDVLIQGMRSIVLGSLGRLRLA